MQRLLPPEERAIWLLDGLGEHAFKMLDDIDVQEYKTPDGVALFMATLRPLYTEAAVVRMGELLRDFFDGLAMGESEHTRPYVQRFVKTLRKVNEINVALPEPARV